jgi:hypothetical protein
MDTDRNGYIRFAIAAKLLLQVILNLHAGTAVVYPLIPAVGLISLGVYVLVRNRTQSTWL